MERLDARATERINGPSWYSLRPQFNAIHSALINVAPSVRGELTTIYIKYRVSEDNQNPFAVVWVKKSTELVIGLALSGPRPNGLIDSPAGCKYAGLTAYLTVNPGDSLPVEFSAWLSNAFETVARQR